MKKIISIGFLLSVSISSIQAMFQPNSGTKHVQKTPEGRPNRLILTQRMQQYILNRIKQLQQQIVQIRKKAPQVPKIQKQLMETEKLMKKTQVMVQRVQPEQAQSTMQTAQTNINKAQSSVYDLAQKLNIKLVTSEAMTIAPEPPRAQRIKR